MDNPSRGDLGGVPSGRGLGFPSRGDVRRRCYRRGACTGGPLPDFPALDVALGLIFLFVILSLVCSAVMETLSSVFAWRAAYLRKGLESMLDEELMERVFRHPLVDPLVRPERGLSAALRRIPLLSPLVRWSRRERYPSYLPSRAVIAALLDLDLAGEKRKTVRSLDEAVERVPNERVRLALEALLADAKAKADTAEERIRLFEKSAETWYDDTMARVSGWYRRRVQLVLWCIALAVAVLLNVDTVNVSRVLWSDESARAALVARAEAAASAEEVQEVTTEVGELQIPLGWSFGDGGPQDFPGGWESWIAKVLGLVITAAALSLGAPFWFDLLGKVARLRSSGAPPPPRTATEAGP